MHKIYSSTKKFLIIGGLFALCFAMTGCLEAYFDLAEESRLPSAVTLPPGLTRADVTVQLNYYSVMSSKQNDEEFIVKDRRGKTLEKFWGKAISEALCLKNHRPGFEPGYPHYVISRVKGTTEIIEHRTQNPIYNKARKRLEALVYIVDDPAIKKELLEGDAYPCYPLRRYSNSLSPGAAR